MSDFVIDEVTCKECALWETSAAGAVRRSQVYGRGNGSSGLWLYADALGRDEVSKGIPLIGDPGRIISKILKEINLNEEDLWITHAVKCRPPNDKNPRAADIKTCMEKHAKLDVPETPPKLIVLLGNTPLKAVLNKQKIKENRGIIFDCEMFNCKAMVTYHPSAIMYNKKTNIYDTLKADLLKAKEFILHEKPVSQQKHHRILINSKKVFLEWMEIFADPNLVYRVGDIETTGLKYWEDKIVSIALTTEIDNEIYSVAFLTLPKSGWWHANQDDAEIAGAIQKVLAQPIDFFRGLFDVQFFWFEGYRVNFRTDVMVQHAMIDDNAPSHRLDYCVSVYMPEGDAGYKQRIKGLIGEEGKHADLPPEILLDYNSDDTYNTHCLNKTFTSLIKAEGVESFFNKMAMPLERSLTRMSYRGIMMDRQRIIDLSNKYREQIKLKREELYDKAGKKFDYSGAEIKTVLFKDLGLPVVKKTDKGMPSSDKYAMEELSRLHEVPKIILELRKIEYYLRMYLDGDDLPLKGEVDPEAGMLCKLDPNDRIHGSFLSVGTISGRPTCPKPNLLNIPKNKEIRSLFISPPGWSLIELDYTQAELVLLANFSGDEKFIADVLSTDFHTATAKSLMKAEVVDSEIRSACKSLNFLKSYGGGAEKLGNALRLNEEKLFFDKYHTFEKYDKVCPEYRAWHHRRDDGVPLKYKTVNRDRSMCYVCEADSWLKKWDETYVKVPQYKQTMMRLWKEQGYIKGIYGRKKRFPPVFTKQQESYCDRISVNYMCQNGVSETINRSMIDIDYMLDNIFGWHPKRVYTVPGLVLGVYDSLIGEAPDELAHDIKDLMYELMTLPIPELNISLRIDVKISKRWGQEDEKQEDTIAIDIDGNDSEEEYVENYLPN